MSTKRPPANQGAQPIRWIGPEGVAVRPLPEHVTPELLRSFYQGMRLSRTLDEILTARQRQGRVGFHGSSEGQEAVAAGTAHAIAAHDWVFPALREASVMLMRGFPLTTWLAQSLGVQGDLLRGRQMPSHMSGRSVNQVSWSSNMATQLPHAVGAGVAARLRGDDTVAIAFLGDGATSEPDFQRALRFGRELRARVLFVCQNNGWAISTPVEAQTLAPELARKGTAYRVASGQVDGNDAVAVYLAVRDALGRIRQRNTPELLECMTYRVGPHSSSDDPSRYRSSADEEAWRKRDPITRLSRYLEGKGLATPADLAAVDRDAHEEVTSALRLVEERAKPKRDSLFSDVYGQIPAHLIQQQGKVTVG